MKTARASFFRRAAAILLAFVMLADLSTTAFTAAGEGARLYRGSFRYSVNEDVFYYSDSFFDISGQEENEHLRTLSAAVAFANDNSGGEDNSGAHITDLLTDLGFDMTGASYDDMDVTDRDTIGTIIAHKTVNGAPLTIVSIRGNNYDEEWASNTLAGTEGDAEGFSLSADKVIERLKTHMADNGLSSAKIWICGYSRAGGVANLVGKYINEHLAEFGISADDLYVYTFEAPASSASDQIYGNIRNITNLNDLVPYVYPVQWGLYLNGVKEYIGSPDETIMAKKLDIFAPDYFSDYKEVKKSVFLRQLMGFITTYLSREQYSENLEEYVCDVSEIIFSKSKSELDEIISYVSDVGAAAKDDSNFFAVVLGLLAAPESESSIRALKDLLHTCLDKCRAEDQPPLTDGEYQTVCDALDHLIEALVPMIAPELEYVDVDESGNSNYAAFYHFATAAMNAFELISEHYNDKVFAHLKAMDTYYTERVDITPGSIFADRVYTYDELGDGLFDKARELGFDDSDITSLKGGYDLRQYVTVTQLEDDFDLVLQTMGKLNKSMKLYSLYRIAVVKAVGYRTYVSGRAEKAAVTVSEDIGQGAVLFAAVRAEGDEAAAIPVSVSTAPDGMTQVSFTVKGEAVYAVAYNDTADILMGDVDRDRDLSSIDVTRIQRYLAMMEYFSAFQNRVGDVDADGEVTILDATRIQRYLAGIISAPGE